MYSDTLFSTRESRRGNKFAQIFATNFDLLGSFPMKLKSEAHETLLLLFQLDGLMPAIICGNAKEIILGELNIKLKESSCPLRQTEPYTPWSNAAERER